MCRNKKEDELVFSTPTKIVNQMNKISFPSFDLSSYKDFIASIHLHKFLQEQITMELTEDNLLILLNSIKHYIISKLFNNEKTNRFRKASLAEQYVIVSEQYEELKKMYKRVKKGKSIRLLSEKEKEKMQKRIRHVSEEELREQYAVKKRNEEFEEWRKKIEEKIEEKWKEQEKMIQECEILFEEMPTASEVKARAKQYKAKLHRIISNMNDFEGERGSVIHFDPRIIIAWCKRV